MDTIDHDSPPDRPLSPPDAGPVITDKRWGVGWAVFAYLGFMLIQFVPGVLAGFCYAMYCTSRGMSVPVEIGDFPPVVFGLTTIVSQLLLIIWVIFLVRVMHGLAFLSGIPWEGRRRLSGIKAAGVGLVVMLLNSVLFSLFPPEEGVEVPLAQMISTNEGLIYFGVMAIFLAPLGEEFLFRGYMFAPLKRRMGDIAAIAVTTALFMLPHTFQLGQYWQGVILVGLLGAVTGSLRAYTGGIKACVVCHMVYNCLLIMIEVFNRLAVSL